MNVIFYEKLMIMKLYSIRIVAIHRSLVSQFC